MLEVKIVRNLSHKASNLKEILARDSYVTHQIMMHKNHKT